MYETLTLAALPRGGERLCDRDIHPAHYGAPAYGPGLGAGDPGDLRDPQPGR